MAWTALRTLAVLASFITSGTLTGLLVPYTACVLAELFYLPPTVPELPDVRADVSQILLALIFLFQLEFFEYLCFERLLKELDNFEMQTIIIEILHIINYIRACFLLSFVISAARSGEILAPIPSYFEYLLQEQSQSPSSYITWGETRPSDQAKTSIAKTALGYFIISFSYVITHYFGLEFAEERAIFRLFQMQDRENALNNNNNNHDHRHHG